jgi:hypothetical protein
MFSLRCNPPQLRHDAINYEGFIKFDSMFQQSSSVNFDSSCHRIQRPSSNEYADASMPLVDQMGCGLIGSRDVITDDGW